MAERRSVKGTVPAQAEDFASIIRLEQTGPGCFRNLYSDLDFQGGHMFGGQLLAQGLAAAMATIEGKRAKSLHAYYLRRGNVRESVDYHVDIVRDGRGFSTRRVTAMQQGKALVEMLCSASAPEQGVLDHRDALAPDVPPPEGLRDMADIAADPAFADCREAALRLTPMQFVDARPVDPERLLRPAGGGPAHVWVRVPSIGADCDADTIACMLAYLQDYWIAIVPWAYQPRALTAVIPQVASLDGNVRFHRHAAEGWMLYEMTSPAGLDAIGLASGRLLDRNGRLLATAAQEVLLRDL
jgi:acyl-CoA thioesterase-2